MSFRRQYTVLNNDIKEENTRLNYISIYSTKVAKYGAIFIKRIDNQVKVKFVPCKCGTTCINNSELLEKDIDFKYFNPPNIRDNDSNL
ncbi:213_t:CDS:2 [Funneliformis caledonium]|uniref:213_t:CDS:1 n=1 Tax=Funneliformis caledonium TaxID=1117310 RepID=A0A9N8WR37_9GLOM|nr:213_t:CDS:2 [Funneliformis caledonium]